MEPREEAGRSAVRKIALGCLAVAGVAIVTGGAACVYLLVKAGQRHRSDLASLDGVASVRLTAAELVSEYGSNEIVADSRYGGRVIEVTGPVSTVGKGVLGGAFVKLSTGQTLGFREVVCHLADPVDAQDLKIGHPAVVRGKAVGVRGNVLLQPCKVVRPASTGPSVPSPIARERPSPTESKSEQETNQSPDQGSAGATGRGPAATTSEAEASRGEDVVLPRLSEARFGDLSISVDDYDLRGNCPGNQPGTSADGAVFVVVYLTASNMGNDVLDLPRVEYELGRYRSGLGAGLPCRYDAEAFGNACWKTGGRLYPGTRCDGWILFEVPQAFDPSEHTVKVTARLQTGKKEVAEWSLKH